jgi:hypothetical protein
MSARVRNDPRMIKEQKELADLQAKRQDLDVRRGKLAVERNSATDPAKMRELTRELDKAEKEYQRNLTAVFQQNEKIDKIKRTIDAEVEGQGGKNRKESGK